MIKLLVVIFFSMITACRANNIDIESHVDQQQVSVKEQIIFSVKIHYNGELFDPTLPSPKIDNGFIVGLGKAKVLVNQKLGYENTIEIRWAIFPLTAGILKIPSLDFTTKIQNTEKMVYLSTSAYDINVSEPLINNIPIAKSFTMQGNWNKNSNTYNLQEIINYTVTLESYGLAAELMPVIAIPPISGYNISVLKRDYENSYNLSGVIGRQIVSLIIIPKFPSDIQIPDFKFTWWNSKNRQKDLFKFTHQKISVSE